MSSSRRTSQAVPSNMDILSQAANIAEQIEKEINGRSSLPDKGNESNLKKSQEKLDQPVLQKRASGYHLLSGIDGTKSEEKFTPPVLQKRASGNNLISETDPKLSLATTSMETKSVSVDEKETANPKDKDKDKASTTLAAVEGLLSTNFSVILIGMTLLSWMIGYFNLNFMFLLFPCLPLLYSYDRVISRTRTALEMKINRENAIEKVCSTHPLGIHN